MEMISQWLQQPYAPLLLVIALIALVVLGLILVGVLTNLSKRERNLQERLGQMTREMADHLQSVQSSAQTQSEINREMMHTELKYVGEDVSRRMNELQRSQQSQLDSFAGQIQQIGSDDGARIEQLTKTMETRLMGYQDQMERTSGALMQQLVSPTNGQPSDGWSMFTDALPGQLDSVYQQLDEMQALVSGAGDVAHILRDMNAQSTDEIVPLPDLIARLMDASEYQQNAKLKPGGGRAPYAIVLPPCEPGDMNCMLPLIELSLQDGALSEDALMDAIANAAERASEQLLNPPLTTDFVVLYLPSETLHAQALSHSSLTNILQQQLHVALAGPVTLSALIRSLQIGMKSAQVGRQSDEIRALLGTVKGEISAFSDALQKTQKRIRQADNALEDASRKTRMIQKRLRDVEKLAKSQRKQLISDDEKYNNQDWD